jgi:hypothetical protein
MPHSKSPRKLGDIAHLFLSTSSFESRPDERRTEAVVWLWASGRSVNRAHLAVGLAAAVSRQGIFVSLLEASRGLPNIGYYFGLEPVDYLAPTLDRTEIVGGLWNGVIRYCLCSDPRSAVRWRPDAVPPSFPHAFVAVFSHPEGSRHEAVLSEMHGAVAPFVESERAGSGAPDALIIAGAGPRPLAEEMVVSSVRALFPETLILRVWRGPCAAPGGADERIEVPPRLTLSWARRMPPVDPFFDDLSSTLFQVLSQRRRRTARVDAIG